MTNLPYTGQEFLDSLDDGREIWIYGERVGKITEHPAFRNCARMLARLYDSLHEDHASGAHVLTTPTEWGGFTHRYFKAPATVAEQMAARDAIAAWARGSYGWLGRSPDYKAAFLATLGANAEFYAAYQDNARRWYLRGSGNATAVDRVKLMKLLWDAVGTEFAGRHELYEINYSGSHEEIRRYALFGALASGAYDRFEDFADTCMAEYDIDGWKVPDLIDPGETSVIRA